MVGISVMSLLPGCIAVMKEESPTLGQQLIDLKNAKDIGAITNAQYQAQKTKLIDKK